MKRIFLISIMLACVSLMQAAITKADADALYEKGNYEEAAAAYESLLKVIIVLTIFGWLRWEFNKI